MTTAKSHYYTRLFVILFIVPITGATIDIYVPSLPAISAYFHSPSSLVKITIAAYLLGYSLAQIPCGILSDVFGRRKPLLLGFVFYTLVSFSAALSQNIEMLIALRFLQGIAIAFPGAIVRAITSDSFTPEELPKAGNYVTIAWALGPIIAPALGGYLQVLWGWRAPFYFLAFYGLANTIIIACLLPETSQFRHPLKLKLFYNNFHRILSNPIFVAGIVSMGLIYGFLILFNTLAPFFIQGILGRSAISYGHVAFLLGLAWLTGCTLNRFLTKTFSINTIMKVFSKLLVISSLLFVGLAAFKWIGFLSLVFWCFTIYVLAAVIYTNCFSQSLRLFPDIAGMASSTMGSCFIAISSLLGFLSSFVTMTSPLPLAMAYLVITVILLPLLRILWK